MAFCSNCGTKLQEGDIFCASCGARVGGERAEAQPNTQPQVFQQTAAALSSLNTEAISKHSKQTLDIILSMLVKPMSAIKILLQSMDEKSTLITGGVLALLQGILSMWKLSQVVSSLDKTVISLAKSMGSMAGVLGGGSGFSPSDLAEITAQYSQFRKMISVPYGLAFLHGIILFLIVAGLIFLGVFAVSKVFSKEKANVLGIGKLAGLSIIPVLGAQVISIIFSYFLPTVGMLILLAGILISFAVLLMNVKEVVGIEDDKLVFALPIVVTIVIGCTLFAVWKFALADVNSIGNSIMENAQKLYK